MNRTRLTQSFVNNLKRSGKPYPGDLYWDSEVPGLHLKVTPEGRRTYLVYYRQNGQQHRPALGQHGVITLDQARDAARRRLYEARFGTPAAAMATALPPVSAEP